MERNGFRIKVTSKERAKRALINKEHEGNTTGKRENLEFRIENHIIWMSSISSAAIKFILPSDIAFSSRRRDRYRDYFSPSLTLESELFEIIIWSLFEIVQKSEERENHEEKEEEIIRNR